MAIQTPSRLYSDVDLTFVPHPQTGDLPLRVDINAVKQSLKNLILTNYYERLFHPEIGSPIRKLLFEPIDIITSHAIQQGLERLIANFEPRVVLESLAVTPNYDNNEYVITINFYIRGVGSLISYSTILRRIR
jgi:phage baseplate assembly protein W